MGRINFKKIFSFLLELVSFDSVRAKVINLSVILISLAMVPTSWIERSPVKCIFREYLLPLIFNNHCPTTGIFFGCTCPACGMTHAMSRLLHLDFIGAWGYNKGVFLVFGIMLFLIVFNGIKWYNLKK
jgi:hypothetical protein